MLLHRTARTPHYSLGHLRHGVSVASMTHHGISQTRISLRQTSSAQFFQPSPHQLLRRYMNYCSRYFSSSTPTISSSSHSAAISPLPTTPPPSLTPSPSWTYSGYSYHFADPVTGWSKDFIRRTWRLKKVKHHQGNVGNFMITAALTSNKQNKRIEIRRKGKRLVNNGESVSYRKIPTTQLRLTASHQRISKRSSHQTNFNNLSSSLLFSFLGCNPVTLLPLSEMYKVHKLNQPGHVLVKASPVVEDKVQQAKERIRSKVGAQFQRQPRIM